MEKLQHRLEALDHDVHALRLKGLVDVFSYLQLKQSIDAFAQSHVPPRLYVDMAEVEYVGSSGWSVFFLQASALEKAGGALCLGAMSGRVQHALTLLSPRKGLLLTASNEAEAIPLLRQSRLSPSS
ncbi:MAG TPA: STAS domain-containing protein [bacterium]|jgi:anti-anti-sigma factor|nr:STAS domain-containing protein [bacterium]